MRHLYFDNNATTALDPRVKEAMEEAFSPIPFNPSSVHFFGQKAKTLLVQARETISHCLHVKPHELIFTSGGTESMSMLLQGFYALNPGCHIISSNVEHACVYHTLQSLEKKGAQLSYLPAGLWGAIKPSQVEAAITDQTKLIVLMSVNNETGVKTDISAIGALAKKSGIPFIVDGVSHLGKELFHIPEGVSGMTFGAHKLHGPQGIGLTWVKPGFKFEPLLLGGPQEYGRRAGSENLAGIMGLAKAIELLKTELPAATERMEKLRDHLISSLMFKLGNVLVHGQGPRICNTAHIAFPGVDAESLLIQLDLAGIAVSHGSACSSGGLEPSRVLINMGIPSSVARSSLRFSLSRMTTEQDIDAAIDIICDLTRKMR
jgi:cysteine desulfurase